MIQKSRHGPKDDFRTRCSIPSYWPKSTWNKTVILTTKGAQIDLKQDSYIDNQGCTNRPETRQLYWQPRVHKSRTPSRRGDYILAPRILKWLLDFWKNFSPLLKTIAISRKFRLETTCYACYRLRRRKLIWIKLKMKRRRNEAVFAEKKKFVI